MKNLHDLLRQKELAVKRLEQDIEAIRTVLAMLAEEPERAASGNINPPVTAPSASLASTPATTGTMYSAAAQNPRPDTQKPRSEWP